jgi:hypothetical protein
MSVCSYAAAVAFFNDIIIRDTVSPLVRDSAADCLAALDRALPSGSGFDARADRLTGADVNDWAFYTGKVSRYVLRWSVPFHVMDDNGRYTRWAQYVVTAKPAWEGSPDVTIRGPSCNGTREYVADVYSEFLARPWCRSFDPASGWAVAPVAE